MTANRSASVLARLLNLAKQRGDDYSLLLNRFALERLLYRVATSAHADGFLLKGALLFALWYDEPHRPTRDADLLGFGQDDAEHLVAVFRDIAAIEADDGIVFDADSVRALAIRDDNAYGGTRIQLVAHIGSARCALQIDVGFGDAVTPEPLTATLPALLHDFAAPTLRVYPVYTVIAEKYHAMATLGMANSRMKDFYDLAVIARCTELDGAILARAIAATFARRSTRLPLARPRGFDPPVWCRYGEIAPMASLREQNQLATAPLAEVVALLDHLLWPATQVANSGSTATATWQANGAKWV